MPLPRILVAIDGSEPADRALALASELARSAEGGTLILVSAISDPVTFAPTPVAGLQMVIEAEQQGAERDLAERAERLRAAGAEVETVVRVGPTIDMLLEEAEACRADLVVAARVAGKCHHPASSLSPEAAPRRSLIPFGVTPCKVRNPWLPGLS